MAGAGFKTFNTGDVLLASEVNTYLMQQTVMVFDDATARTSALGANVAEGMFSYLKDTNLTYRYDGSAWLSDAGTTSPLTTKGDLWTYSTTDARLPVGTDGYTLVADSGETTGLKWAAPSAGANWTLLNSGGTALTGAATVTVSGISGADKIAVFIVGASSANANAFITVRVNADSGNNYYTIQNYWVAGSTYGVTNISGDALWPANTIYLARTRATDAGGSAAGAITFSGCNSSGVKTYIGQGGGYANGAYANWELYHNQGYYNSSSTISSVSVFSTSGNLDAGTVYVYTSV